MTDWVALVRARLPESSLSGQREEETVQELAALLRDAAEDAGLTPDSELEPASDELERFADRELSRWREDSSAPAPVSRPLAPRSPAAAETRRPSSRASGSMSGLRSDLAFAVRVLRKSPVFAGIAVLTLALGIGLNSAVFSVVDSLLFRPTGVAEPGRVVRIYSTTPDGFMSHEPMAYPDYRDLRERGRSFGQVAGHAMTQLALEHDGEPVIVIGETVSGNYFDTLGLEPAQGRLFTDDDDRIGAGEAVAVVNHATWLSRFGGGDVVGRTIHLNGHPVTVIGVAPAGFRSLLRGITPEVWIPVNYGLRIGTTAMQGAGSRDPELPVVEDRGRRWWFVVARLAPGATGDQAEAELGTLAAALEEEHPKSNEERGFAGLPLHSVKLFPGIDQGLEMGSWLLLGVVGLILLIAAANLANMLLARALGRRREIATRLSLGAGRAQIVRQLLIESLLLAAIGGLLGLAVAWLSNRMINSFELPMVVPISFALGLNVRVLLFTLAISTATAVAFGLVPALEATRTDLAGTLREAGARSGSLRRRRLQGTLVVVQVALSVVLLACAGLSLRSVLNAQNIDPGFDVEGLVTANIDPELQGYDRDRTEQIYRRLIEELRAFPGVRSVALASHLPLTMYINTWTLIPEGQEALPRDEWPDIDVASVGSSYFRTMGIEILRGREFDERERAEGPAVAVINETLAERFWPGEDPIGKRVKASLDSEPMEVVGVARNGKYRSLGEPARPHLYRSLEQGYQSSRFVVARFEEAGPTALAALRRTVRGLDEHLAITALGTVRENTTPSRLLPQVGAVLFGGFGGLGLLLAGLGLYGVLAFGVSQRTHEIGIRMALGAQESDVLRLVVTQGVVLTAIGIAIGVALSLGVTRFLEAALYGIRPTDLPTFVGVMAVMVAAAVAACAVPAMRAARVDPLGALRYE